ncbi:MAG: hypothetical protein B7Z60_03010 [Ferrovum sp. 37-45-19]|jgi:hypothetical protein|uniref:hypothetical protein n=1 Tax=Ferrovum sp. JA12 TaxID=1356299 RepID=UPI00070252EF|nr:hypothetical protein [Ferrovum sp. JA12]OYV80471.1 MAG: hypothetical protein B7Z65_01080 [Ferrovum sp. 21-44-67]OYV94786.1 MAG: hypothetical protein B7Z60_03010 [Ferrovum sp. 37-45-19]OZB34180.1 MAG: hypothetical protein B7X47_02160 [Ferrovum sp. 34-44-207]HQT81093.1 hypothetical protein [Ferrovaceae bacterium]KRH79181.1 hypothetical protein FERRO_02440 [Ferrovum sp. JA12]
MEENQVDQPKLDKVTSQWGKLSDDHLGYASDEERRSKRGLEDWELVEKIPESQRPVPYWFFAVVVVVLLVGVGLAFPFWGTRPGHQKHWLDWGFAIALAYIAVAGYFVYYMVKWHGDTAQGGVKENSEQGSQDAQNK